MTIAVGVDAGGTKTVAVVSDGTHELGRAAGAAGAVRPGRALAAATAIAATTRAALRQAGLLRGDIMVVGAAGVGREEERQALRDALRIESLADRLVITTDIEIALQSAFGEGPGIVLLAGTGSFAVGRLPAGELARQGGYGWQMGDDGSAYAIGRAALAAVGRAQDGRAPATALTPALVAATRVGSFNDLVRWSVVAGPTEVAGLAPAVLHAARAGDQVAGEILRGAAADLVAQVLALRPRYPDAGQVEVALAGGLLEDDGLKSLVAETLVANGQFHVVNRPLDPAQGALSLAAKQ